MNALRHVRLAAGWKREQLADEAGVSVALVKHLECSKRLPDATGVIYQDVCRLVAEYGVLAQRLLMQHPTIEALQAIATQHPNRYVMTDAERVRAVQ